jgi:hypothetical protein
MYGQFGKSSGLIPSASNPIIGTYGWRLFGAPVSFQGWYSGLYRGSVVALLSDNLGEIWMEGFFSTSFDLIGCLFQAGALK